MNGLCSYSSRFVEIMNYFELVQHNVLPICNGNQLDLILTNKLDVTVDVTVKVNSSTQDALEAGITINANSKQCDTSKSKRTVYNF